MVPQLLSISAGRILRRQRLVCSNGVRIGQELEKLGHVAHIDEWEVPLEANRRRLPIRDANHG